MISVWQSVARHIVAGLAIGVMIASGGAASATIAPTYTAIFGDATTDGNQTLKTDGKYGWTITPGADDYGNEIYERPTTQSFETMTAEAGGTFVGAKEYYQNLDIASGRAGYDDNYLYVAINMVGTSNVTENGNQTLQGLIYNYMFLLALTGDGGNGYMFSVDAPTLVDGGDKENPNTEFSALKTTGYFDTNGDVGGSGALDGLAISKTDDAGAAIGNGYDRAVIGDGRLLSGPNVGLEILFARINPLDSTEVEFALNYGALGYLSGDLANLLNGLGFLDLRAVRGGNDDPQNFLWNDEYTLAESGSPYSVPGTQNIYEADNLRLVAAATPAVPEPSTWAMMLLGFGAVGFSMRRRRRVIAQAV